MNKRSTINKHFKKRYNVQDSSKENKNLNDEKNEVLKAFKSYRDELDAKHDRYERIVKLSRDVTIEAKRIIFLLHSIDARKANRAKVVQETEQRLDKLIKTYFCDMAKELQGQDIYQYRGAYTSGVQEFVEAYTFTEYMKYADEVRDNTKQMSSWSQLQEKMCCNKDDTTPNTTDSETSTYTFIIEPSDFMLGLADLSGELMRRCINSLGSGETNACVTTCQTLQNLYRGYLGLSTYEDREFSRKIFTMRQSVLKAETVCYNIKVRGGEAAKFGSIFQKPDNDVDEGIFS